MPPTRHPATIYGAIAIAVAGIITAGVIVYTTGNAGNAAVIIGFATTTIATLLNLQQTSVNTTQGAVTQAKVEEVSTKVDGHTAALTQIVASNAASAAIVAENATPPTPPGFLTQDERGKGGTL